MLIVLVVSLFSHRLWALNRLLLFYSSDTHYLFSDRFRWTADRTCEKKSYMQKKKAQVQTWLGRSKKKSHRLEKDNKYMALKMIPACFFRSFWVNPPELKSQSLRDFQRWSDLVQNVAVLIHRCLLAENFRATLIIPEISTRARMTGIFCLRSCDSCKECVK